MPAPTRLPEYPANFPSLENLQATSQAPATEPERSASASTSTLPPLEAEFLPELDFGGMGAAGVGMNGMMNTGDGFDWDALMNDRELWNNIGGGWSDGILDDQSLR